VLWGRWATSSTLLTVQTGCRAGVSLVEFEQDVSDIVHGNVYSVGDTRDGEDTLIVSLRLCTGTVAYLGGTREHGLGRVQAGA
jgi:hypothetical protein